MHIYLTNLLTKLSQWWSKLLQEKIEPYLQLVIILASKLYLQKNMVNNPILNLNNWRITEQESIKEAALQKMNKIL